jgi:sulfide:quinone oxidoreductase
VRPLAVLIAGGGVAAVEAALALRHLAGDRVRLSVMAPGPDLVRRPESVGTPFTGVGAGRLPLERLGALGVDLRQDAVAAVDADRRDVRTADGVRLSYDRLVIATGAQGVESVPGAVHFRGPISAGRVEGCVAAARRGGAPLTFVVPPGVTWALPLYELALQAAAALAHDPGAAGVRIVTPEPRPLDIFGPRVSDAVARLLNAAGVDVRAQTRAEAVLQDHLVTDGGTFTATGPVVTVPVLEGPRLAGLSYDAQGFLAVDAFGRVHGEPAVLAAGDVTRSAIKQGGLAAQQADAVATAISADAGAPVEPAPATRILRAELMTADRPLYLRAWPGTARPGQVSRSPLWDPPGKLAGRFLSGFIATGAPDRQLVDLEGVAAPIPVSSTNAH